MTPRITIVGCGYLGATHAACMAELGYDVLGIDIDETRVAALQEARLPFYEPGLEPMLRKHVESGRLRFTTSYQEIADFGDVHFVCVSTPQREGELAADISHLDAAVESLAPLLQRPALIVGKSTVPVGTAERIADRIAEIAPVHEDAVLVWNPEFLREGFAVEDTLCPTRLVFGLPDSPQAEAALATMRGLFSEAIDAGAPVVVADLATAQLAKVAANSFLATKISFINAMAEICEASGADVTVLAEALGHDPRIGRAYLNAGLGFGGGCLPKDIRGFMARAGELGAGGALTFLREVDAINMRRRTRVVDLTAELLGRPWSGAKIAVLGAAFKPDSDDIRDSPALNVAGRLHLFGAHVRVHDPQANENARRSWPTLHYAPTAVDACEDADVVLVLTEWQQFRDLDPTMLAGVVKTPAIVDARNCLDSAAWVAAGWTYRGLGRP
jgi:UDPglucose 6-dehydrogenase